MEDFKQREPKNHHIVMNANKFTSYIFKQHYNEYGPSDSATTPSLKLNAHVQVHSKQHVFDRDRSKLYGQI